MEKIYFVVIEGVQNGPLSFEELRTLPITRETYVWRQGMENWQRAEELPELLTLLSGEREQTYYTPGTGDRHDSGFNNDSGKGPDFANNPQYGDSGYNGQYDPRRDGNNYGQPHNPYGGQPQNPYGQPQNPYGQSQGQYGGNPQNPYGQPQNPYGQPQNPYGGQSQNPYGNPYGNQYNPYGRQGDQYGQNPYDNSRNNPYGRQMPTNWLPWAIVATIVGFLFSCIGAIFGIIGIIQANKANTFFAYGNTDEGERSNANAKTMTIIGFCLAGLGLIIGFSAGFFGN